MSCKFGGLRTGVGERYNNVLWRSTSGDWQRSRLDWKRLWQKITYTWELKTWEYQEHYSGKCCLYSRIHIQTQWVLKKEIQKAVIPRCTASWSFQIINSTDVSCLGKLWKWTNWMPIKWRPRTWWSQVARSPEWWRGISLDKTQNSREPVGRNKLTHG